jgi:hypothetical protein
MKTEVLIPIKSAVEDPKWLTKRHAGKRLNPEEFQAYA